MRMALPLLLVLTLPAITSARSTWYVPDDFATIQSAVDGSSDGDLVIVRPGTYVEKVHFNGKGIALKSDAGPQATIIDGNRAGSVVIFDQGESVNSILEGFTITNGVGTLVLDGVFEASLGGGILCTNGSSPTITSNVICSNAADDPWYMGFGGGIACLYSASPLIACNTIVENHATMCGGGIYCDEKASPSILGNIISENWVIEDGGGLALYDSEAQLDGNIVSHNSASSCGGYGGGIDVRGSKGVVIANTLVFENYVDQEGGGICCAGASITITNCTVVKNHVFYWGGGIDCPNASPKITNTILWGNDKDQIEGGSPSVAYSNVQGGWPGPGNIDEDPGFADEEADDYRLKFESPCVDRGNNEAAGISSNDLDGYPRIADGDGDSHSTVDMGAFEFMTLKPDSLFLPAAGGSVHFDLDAGWLNQGRSYLVLGTLSGAVPGIPLPGGQVILPIKWDGFTDFVVAALNTPCFPDFMASLDRRGRHGASMNAHSIHPGHVGKILHFAYCLEGSPWDFVSNPVAIEIVPATQ